MLGAWHPAVPSAPISTFRSMLLNELTDGMEIDQVLLVREAERRQRRDGGDYLRLQLGDRTGAVACMVWEELEQVEELARAGAPVLVRGRYTVHPRFGPQINLRALQQAPAGSYVAEDLRDGPARTLEQMEGEIRELLATIQEPHLRALLEAVFGEGSELWAEYRVAPAAKHYHQAYRHGLLEHSLGVAQAVSAISATFPGIDRDVAVTGALLHDIGKLEAYTEEGGGHRPHRRRPPARRDRARLLPDPPGDRGHRRVPAGARAGGLSHHPLPPRHARARQPGRAVHARGDARAHDRQPRRAARAASTGSRRSSRRGAAGRRSTARSAPARSSPRATDAAAEDGAAAGGRPRGRLKRRK